MHENEYCGNGLLFSSRIRNQAFSENWNSVNFAFSVASALCFVLCIFFCCCCYSAKLIIEMMQNVKHMVHLMATNYPSNWEIVEQTRLARGLWWNFRFKLAHVTVHTVPCTTCSAHARAYIFSDDIRRVVYF